MKRLIYIMSVAALAVMQSCSFEEPGLEPETPQGEPYKVSIHNDIFQQPATKVTTDGFCTGDELWQEIFFLFKIGTHLVNRM